MSNENFCAAVENGVVFNIIVVEANSTFLTKNPEWIFIGDNSQGVGIGWNYDGNTFSPPPPPPPLWLISKVAMISRFTPEEYVGVVGAIRTDVQIQAWYDLFQAANVVNLKDPRTISGVNAMVSKNLLTQIRADQILNTPAKPGEL